MSTGRTLLDNDLLYRCKFILYQVDHCLGSANNLGEGNGLYNCFIPQSHMLRIYFISGFWKCRFLGCSTNW